jgi:transcriptional regulator with XRE-family HTH domain
MPLDGYRITQRRTLLGYSQEELADMVGTSQKMISLYEKGSVPNGLKLRSLAEALQTTTDYLLGMTDNPDRPLRNLGDLSDDEREILRAVRSNKDYLKIVKSLLKSLSVGVG